MWMNSNGTKLSPQKVYDVIVIEFKREHDANLSRPNFAFQSTKKENSNHFQAEMEKSPNS